ncbi:winged helix-turn-helix domain-containing protein [Flavonifractor plautii]|nr:winged helix-turn-helix domain-containing protein [Flavonifractor plautii]
MSGARSRIRRGGLDFDLEERAVYCGEEPLHLTRGEYAICAHLAAHPAQTFTKEQIYEAVFGFDGTADSSAITEHIKNIRAKLRAVGLSPIQTVWGWATNGKAHEAADGAHRPVLALPARHRRGGGAAGRPLVGRPVRPAPQRLCPPGGHRRRAGGRAGPRPGGRGADPGGATPLLPLGRLRRLRPGGGAARHGRAAPGLCLGRAGGDRTLHGFPYQQYHRSAQLPDGTVCLLQFDYSMPYGSPALQGRLPEFQTCATAVLLAGWLAAGALSTRHFAYLLRRDAALLTAATGAIAARRLDVPWTGAPGCGSWGEPGRHGAAPAGPGPVSVRAVGHGAGAHPGAGRPGPRPQDPLSIVSGSAELLEEDALSPPSGSAWTPFSAALAASGTIWSSSAPLPPPGARRRRADGRRRSCPRWRRAGRPPGAACAPQRAALFSGLPRLPPLYPVPVGVGPGGAQPAGQRRPLHRRGAVRLSAYVEEAVLTVAVEDSGPGFSPRPWPGRGGAFTPATLVYPGGPHGHGPHLCPAGGPPPRRDADAVQHEPGRPGGPHPAPLKKAARFSAPPSVFLPVPRYHRGRTHPNTVRSAL